MSPRIDRGADGRAGKETTGWEVVGDKEITCPGYFGSQAPSVNTLKGGWANLWAALRGWSGVKRLNDEPYQPWGAGNSTGCRWYFVQ
jgi:hypothetical protein